MDLISFLRQYKIGPFAIFDSALAFVGVYFLAPILTKLFRKVNLDIPRSAWLWLTLPISVLFHVVFNQNTPLMKMLLDPSGFYEVKIVLLILSIIGLSKIRLVGHKTRFKDAGK